MTDCKRTKRALSAAILAVVLCVAMLVGTTLAWFTDTASTSVNKVQAGTLDVALLMLTETTVGKDGTTTETWKSAEGETLKFADVNGNTDIKWEPGCTFTLPKLKIVNNGNLALKYKIAISGISGSAKLSEAIVWTMKLDNYDETLGTEHQLAAKPSTGESANTFTISGHMKEGAGIEYQGLSIDGISIAVYATQAAVEYDSNNNIYDQNATYKLPDTIKDGEALDVSSGTFTLPTSDSTGNNTADLSGDNITISGAGKDATTLEVTKTGYTIGGSNVTVKDVTINGNEDSTTKWSYGLVLSGDNTTLDGVKINAKNTGYAARGVFINRVEKDEKVTIKNSEISTTGEEAFYVLNLWGELLIEDSTLTGSKYSLQIMASNKKAGDADGPRTATVKNTTLNGGIFVSTSIASASFSGCKISGNENYVNAEGTNIIFSNCTFAEGFKISVIANNVKITFSNCTLGTQSLTSSDSDSIVTTSSGYSGTTVTIS